MEIIGSEREIDNLAEKIVMDTTSKTAEKIKTFVDQVDTKVQELERDIKDLVQASKIKYQGEVERIKELAKETKGELEQLQEQMHKSKETFTEMTSEARTFMETKMEPLNQKVSMLKGDVAKYSDHTEEKWQEIKKETEELLETTKLAVHNFKETFRTRQES